MQLSPRLIPPATATQPCADVTAYDDTLLGLPLMEVSTDVRTKAGGVRELAWRARSPTWTPA